MPRGGLPRTAAAATRDHFLRCDVRFAVSVARVLPALPDGANAAKDNAQSAGATLLIHRDTYAVENVRVVWY